MAVSWIHSDEGSVALDSETRLATVYDTQGQQVGEPRPYTAEENAAADAAAAAEQADSNKRTITEALAEDFTAMQDIIAQTNADLRADPAQEIKALARAMRRQIRIARGDYTGTE